jgi:hypothetical protein
MQWRPFLPKEGGLIQVDIGGHPPVLVVEPDYLPDSEVLDFSRVYTP